MRHSAFVIRYSCWGCEEWWWVRHRPRRAEVGGTGVDVEAHLDFGAGGPGFDFVGAEAKLAGEGIEVAAEFEVAQDARDVVGLDAGEIGVGQLCWACHVWSPLI